MTDVERIAAGLTKARKGALMAFNGERYMTPKQAGVSGAAAYSLWNLPVGPNLEAPNMILSRDYADWPRLAHTYRLTPLGLAVRAHLEGKAHD